MLTFKWLKCIKCVNNGSKKNLKRNILYHTEQRFSLGVAITSVPSIKLSFNLGIINKLRSELNNEMKKSSPQVLHTVRPNKGKVQNFQRYLSQQRPH